MIETFNNEYEVVKQFINTAEKYLGIKEGSANHTVLLAVYNSNKPSGEYTMQLADPWCSAFIGAVSALAGTMDTVPLSAHCDRLVSRLTVMGGYIVDEPQMGDLFRHDYDGNGEGDHIGIVRKVHGYFCTCIEGNYSNKVSLVERRWTEPSVTIYRPKWSNCIGKTVNRSTESIQWEKYRDFYAELSPNYQCDVRSLPLLYGGCGGLFVKILQKYLGIKEDGHFGTDTETAVKLYQKKRQLEVDGQVGKQTWSSFFV